MKPLSRVPRVLVFAVAFFAGDLCWQLAMHGTLPSDPLWYLVGVPISLLFAVVVTLGQHEQGGAR